MKRSERHLLLQLAAALLAAVVLSTGCTETGSGPSGPDPDPEPGPEGNARLTFEVLVPAADGLVADYSPDWSADDDRLVFAGPPGSTVWSIASGPGGLPAAITDPSLGQWLTGSYAPGYLDDDLVAYALNWHGNTLGMFLLTAPANSTAGEPGPDLLHLFLGKDVGLAENQVSSPMALTYAAAGDRAAGVWRAPWLLDWRADTLRTISPRAMLGGGAPRISRDGERVVFTDDAGAVVWMAFEDEIGENIGAGSHPSWRDDGRVVGYLGANGHYALYNLETRRTVWYRVSGVTPLKPVLSRDGTRVAFLFQAGGRDYGLGVGELLLD